MRDLARSQAIAKSIIAKLRTWQAGKAHSMRSPHLNCGSCNCSFGHTSHPCESNCFQHPESIWACRGGIGPPSIAEYVDCNDNLVFEHGMFWHMVSRMGLAQYLCRILLRHGEMQRITMFIRTAAVRSSGRPQNEHDG